MNRTSDLRKTFERVVVINLARRRDRLARFVRSLDDWPFEIPWRFEAVDGLQVAVPEYWKKGPGAWGCMLSHRGLLGSAIASGVSSLLVLEDDAHPVPGFAALAAGFLAKVPFDWDCLMFGGEHLREPVPISPGVVRCTAANRTHAFALRGKMMPILLKYWHHYKTEHCDIVLASLMRHFNVYAPDPFLIGQNGGFSDVTETNEGLRFLTAGQVGAIEQPAGAVARPQTESDSARSPITFGRPLSSPVCEASA